MAAAELVPDLAEGQALGFLDQRETAGRVALDLVAAQAVERLEQREQQRLLRGPCADDPRGDAVDAGVEIIEPDMGPAKVTSQRL